MKKDRRLNDIPLVNVIGVGIVITTGIGTYHNQSGIFEFICILVRSTIPVTNPQLLNSKVPLLKQTGNGLIRIIMTPHKNNHATVDLDGADHLDSSIAGCIGHIVPDLIGSRQAGNQIVLHRNACGQVPVISIIGNGAKVQILGVLLNGNLGCTDQLDNRGRGVDHIHNAFQLYGGIVMGILYIVGNLVDTDLLVVQRAGGSNAGSHIPIDNVRRRDPGIDVVRKYFNCNLGITDKGDDRVGGIDHRHLARHLNCRIAVGVRDVVAHGVLAKLGLVHRVDDRGL